MDISAEPLELMERLAGARVTATTRREEALEGADLVVSTIAVGGFRGRDRPEIVIPERYGIKQSVADTIGVGGVFVLLLWRRSLGGGWYGPQDRDGLHFWKTERKTQFQDASPGDGHAALKRNFDG